MGENRCFKQRVFKFSEKPADDVIASLKDAGFTYRAVEKAWTITANPDTRKLSDELAPAVPRAGPGDGLADELRVRRAPGRGDVPGQLQIEWSGVSKPATVRTTSPLPAPLNSVTCVASQMGFRDDIPTANAGGIRGRRHQR